MHRSSARRPKCTQINRAIQALMRRGPDEAQAQQVDKGLWMAYTRLSINNPLSGPRPLKRASG